MLYRWMLCGEPPKKPHSAVSAGMLRSWLQISPRLMSPDLGELAPTVRNFVMNFQMNLKTMNEVMLEQKQTGQDFRITSFNASISLGLRCI